MASTTTATKDFAKKVNSVRRKLGELTNISADADQSTNQSTTMVAHHYKSFAHMETSSEEICDTIEAFMNANCSKYAANKTIQKLCSSNSSKEIDLTLNHLSMSEVVGIRVLTSQSGFTRLSKIYFSLGLVRDFVPLVTKNFIVLRPAFWTRINCFLITFFLITKS